MCSYSTIDVDPTSIPLPPSEDTNYYTSSPARNSSPLAETEGHQQFQDFIDSSPEKSADDTHYCTPSPAGSSTPLAATEGQQLFLDPTFIPLPPSDDTNYYTPSPAKNLIPPTRTEGQQLFRNFINFSPEKRLDETPGSAQITVKKRRSPRKHAQSNTSPIVPIGISRGFRSSPLKPTGVFDGITKPITAEERKRARRRRVTQEFRDFSAIDLNSLKDISFLPPPPVIEEAEEAAEELHGQQEEQLFAEETDVKPEAKVEKDGSMEDLMVEDFGEQAVEEKEEEGVCVKTEMQEESHDVIKEESDDIGNGRSSFVVPPLNRTRQYRSSSAPPVPHAPEDMAANTFSKFSKSTTAPMDVDTAHELDIANLNHTIAELQDKLETADVQIDRLKAELIAERRLKIAADRAREFVEIERKFGVCCEYNPGFKPPKEKLGPAAVQLPNSSPPHVPVMEENRKPLRPKSRLGRPASRLGDRSTNKFGGERPSERPPTRLGGYNSRNAAPAPAATQATKKRTREEPPVLPGKKAPAARPEKRVLSGSAAANIMLGSSNTASALSKKPEKAVGRSMRSAAGVSTTRAGALARGARR